MRSRNGVRNWLLVVCAGFSGLILGTPGAGGPAAPAAKPGGEAQAPATASAASGFDPGRPLVDFLRISEPGESDAIAARLEALRSRADVEFLIAAVPDPIDSRLSYRFDSIVDDIQMAIESQGWNLDQFWLPWHPSGQQLSTRSQLDPTFVPASPAAKVKLGEAEAKGPALHEGDPGILVFRKATEGSQKLLLLFLVGETPTAGLHKVALTKCFDLIERHRLGSPAAAGATPPPLEIRIVGPHFTGSAPSLALAIKAWCAANRDCPWRRAGTAFHRTFVIRTGSASRIDRGQFAKQCGPHEAPSRLEIRFDSAVIHSDVVMIQMLRTLDALNGRAKIGKIALLSESDTEFGNNNKANGLNYRDLGYDVTEMKFPFHISQVAVAYDQSRQANARNLPTLARVNSKLRIPFDETGRPRDIVPSLAPAMSSATDEFVLSKILETISDEEYRYVGILASDTRDVIFLAGLIREFCPDVQLFTTTGDLLLGHPDYAAELRGMLVASTYPLFSMAQRWDPPYSGDRRRHLFSHEADQGYYNATLSLLGEAGRRRGEGSPFGYYDSMYDYGRPFDELEDMGLVYPEGRFRLGPLAARPDATHRPPLWFGVIGKRGLWPIGFHPDPEAGANPGQAGDYLHVEAISTDEVPADRFVRQFAPLVPQFTWQWGTALLILSAAAVSLFLAHLRIAGAAGAWLGPAEMLRPLGGEGRFQREAFAFAGLAALAAGYLYVGVYPCWITLWESSWRVFNHREAWAFLSSGDRLNWKFAWFSLWTCQAVTLILASTVIARAALVAGANPSKVQRGMIGAAIAAAILAFLAVRVEAGWAYHLPASGEHLDRSTYHPLLFFERAVSLGNGVSPLTPVVFLLAAAGAWVTCHLRRLGLIDRSWTGLALGAGTAHSGPMRRLAPLKDRGEAVIEVLRRFFVRGAALHPLSLTGWGLVALVLIRIGISSTPGVDGWLYSRALLSAISVLILAIALTFCRFLFLARRILMLLRELALLPMLPSYDRVPEGFSRLLGRYLDDARPRLENLTVPIQAWVGVARGFPGTVADAVQKKMREVDPSHFAGQFEEARSKILGHCPGRPEAIQLRFSGEVAHSEKSWAPSRSESRAGLAGASAACLEVLCVFWPGKTPAHDPSPSPAEPPKPAPAEPAPDPDPLQAWLSQAEDFVALEMVTYVSQCTVHLRSLAAFLAVVPLLLLFAVSVYPFQPQRFLLVSLWAVLLGVAAGVIWAYIELDRDEVLSRISRTLPSRVTLDGKFLTNILTFVVPLLGVLVAQFPGVSDTLNLWFEPILRILK